ncbi:MAG TPA: rhamnogalacturonan acetylesterase [Verrucomicrobiae bacterium]
MRIVFALVIAISILRIDAAENYRFDFGSGKVAATYTPASPAMEYTETRGYGFDLGSQVQAVNRGGNDPLLGDFVTSDKPFFFSVALPEGNYNVTVTFGDAQGAGTNTVKAESRRLMIEDVRTAPGKFETRTFTVNIRTPKILAGGAVRLKDREKPYLHWDNKLTIEFNGARPCVAALEIARATNAITVYLAGDSTVTDQPAEPWNSWGQMLTRFLKPGVAVANHAESGESFKSSISARRFDKIFGTLQAGDYLFMQFGHNDMKDRASNALANYKSSLERFVDEARKRGATPVLLTSMERKAGVERDTLGEYPATVRAVAQEKGVALIDLHAMSKILYRALGNDLDKAFQDGTHHNNYGSYELARCVVEGIRQNKLGLAKFIIDDVPVFDPAKPDPVKEFSVPPSPQRDAAKPDGN